MKTASLFFEKDCTPRQRTRHRRARLRPERYFSDALVVRKNDSNLFAAVRGGKVCDAEKETAFRYS